MREEVLKEADAWFLRNRESLEQDECSVGMRLFSEFYDDCREEIKINRVLEVGCSNGRNLMFLQHKYGMECYGIDPSEKALQYGKKQILNADINIKLERGYSDHLPYPDSYFDMIYFGFCLYQVDRSLLFQTFAEMNRTLRMGGYVS